MSENSEAKSKAEKLGNRFFEKQAKVGFDTYSRFFLSNPRNYILLPVTILFYCLSEVIIAIYYRFLSDIDKLASNTSKYFGSSYGSFWGVLAALVVGYFLVLVLKYYCLNVCVLNSSTHIH